jgi:membrane associated rhomboid family serine protease
MNSPRIVLRPPTPAGPPMLWILVLLMTGAHLLRALFALPTQIPPGALSMEGLQKGEWWSVLTYMFTHQDLLHLLTNVLLLVIAGRAVERQAGGRHLLYIFIAGAWAGAALHLLFWPEAPPIVGASGAAFGVIGAFSALFPEYDLMRPLRGFLPGRLKAKRLFPALLAAHVGLELMRRFYPGAAFTGIAEQAHLVHAGGLLAGWFYGRYLATEGAAGAETWNDFFPQGLRRRHREMDGGLPVAAGAPPLHREESAEAPEPPHELSDREFLAERVDPILEKLYEKGADQLTPEERAVLEEASRRFSKGRF